MGLSNNANNANDLIPVEKRISRSVCLLFSLVQLALHFSRKMVVDKNLTFVKQMKKATQEIHDLSDAMINAKLGIAMTDDKVWAEGLLYFYEIFKFLEEALDRLGHTSLSEFDVEGMRRTKQFKADLDFWYGEDWMNNVYVPDESVANYIEYLKELEKDNHNMLAAYYYHLCWSVLWRSNSAQKKRNGSKTQSSQVTADSKKGQTVTDFGEIPIARLKRQMIEAVETIASQLEKKTKLVCLKRAERSSE